MTIAVFGGSGRTGQYLLREALEQKFSLKVLVRDPAKIPFRHANMEIIQGDATRPEDVWRTIEGTSAVVSVLGYVKGSQKGFQTQAMHNMLNGMKHFGVTRIAILTGSGVVLPGEKETPGNTISKLIKRFCAARFEDGVNQCTALVSSPFDWTIVRAPLLAALRTHGDFKTNVQKLKLFSRISRPDAACFLLTVIKENSFVKQAPIIAY